MKTIVNRWQTWTKALVLFLLVGGGVATEALPSPVGVTPVTAQRCNGTGSLTSEAACERLRRNQGGRCSGDGQLCQEWSVCGGFFGFSFCMSFGASHFTQEE